MSKGVEWSDVEELIGKESDGYPYFAIWPALLSYRMKDGVDGMSENADGTSEKVVREED